MKPLNLSDIVRKQPRCKWFSKLHDDAEDGWFGPWHTMEEAILEAACSSFWEVGMPVYVAQGRKLTKSEREEYDSDYEWEVGVTHSMKIELPDIKKIIQIRQTLERL